MTEKVTEKAKRYNILFPINLYNELANLAEVRKTTVVELIRKFLTLGLWLIKQLDNPDTQFIVRQEGKEREIVIF